MKRILFPLAVVTLLFTGCYKQPDYDALTSKAIVVTNHDASAVFSSYQTYYLPPFVGEIADDIGDSILDANTAAPILEAIRTNMNSRGYTEIMNSDSADIGIRVVTITVTTTGTYYPGYWWGYGGYYPYYPYYPYSYTYSYSTGSMIIEFIDILNANDVSGKANVVWTSFSNGVLGNTSTSKLAVDAVNQSFKQSPFIQAN